MAQDSINKESTNKESVNLGSRYQPALLRTYYLCYLQMIDQPPEDRITLSEFKTAAEHFSDLRTLFGILSMKEPTHGEIWRPGLVGSIRSVTGPDRVYARDLE